MHTLYDEIYARHFGFGRPLFEDSASAGQSVYLGESQSRIMDDLAIALCSRDSVMVLTGPAGIGKTTLGYSAAASIADRQSIISLCTAPETAKEFVELLLLDFGMTGKDIGRAESTQLWKQIVAEQTVSDQRTVILIENAQNWDAELLQNLHSITAAEPNGYPGVNVILTGTQDLRDLVKSPAIESLAQRIRAVCRVDPMTEDEMRGFFDRELELVGGKSAELFGPGSLGLLHCYSKGVPRVSRNLCESALSLAATRADPIVSAKSVRDAAVDLHGLGHACDDDEVPLLPLTDKWGVAEDAEAIWAVFVGNDGESTAESLFDSDPESSADVYDENEYAAQIEAALGRG